MDSIPAGLQAEMRDEGTIVLRASPNGFAKGCMIAFMLVWASIWVGGMILLATVLVHIGSWALFALPLVAFLGAGAVGLAAFVTFGQRVLLLEPDVLAVETSFFGYRWRKTERREAIVGVEEVPYRDEDHWVTWRLHVYGERKIVAPFRLRPEQTAWLGELIARWAGVAFRGSLEREWSGARPRKKDPGPR